MAEFSPEFIADVLASFFRRCERVKAVGGVALCHVVGGIATVPPGWQLDPTTEFYIPPHFSETEH